MIAMTTPPSIEVEPGVVLQDRSDMGLAQQWARHALGERWSHLDSAQREQYVHQALAELHRGAFRNRDRSPQLHTRALKEQPVSVIYTVAQGKGGVGKSTTAAELVHFLAAGGRTVLAIDLDQQANLSQRLGVVATTELNEHQGRGLTATEVLLGEASFDMAAIEAPSVPGAQILVGSHDLADVEKDPRATDLVTSLRDTLPNVATRWDAVVIDTPPALGGLTLAGLAAADAIIVPVCMTAEAYDQVGRLSEILDQRIGRRIRPGQEISWIVPTKFDGRRRIDREVLAELRNNHGEKVLTPVREAIAAADSYAAGMPLGRYDPRSRPALDYADALQTITGKDRS